jgi:hypothetical protein
MSQTTIYRYCGHWTRLHCCLTMSIRPDNDRTHYTIILPVRKDGFTQLLPITKMPLVRSTMSSTKKPLDIEKV